MLVRETHTTTSNKSFQPPLRRLLQFPTTVRSMAIFHGLRFEVVDSKANLTIKRHHRRVGYYPLISRSQYTPSRFSFVEISNAEILHPSVPSYRIILSTHRNYKGLGLRPYPEGRSISLRQIRLSRNDTK